ncbi:hypothetical protein LXL04_021692 [Taraxacum kok-saghyz]
MLLPLKSLSSNLISFAPPNPKSESYRSHSQHRCCRPHLNHRRLQPPPPLSPSIDHDQRTRRHLHGSLLLPSKSIYSEFTPSPISRKDRFTPSPISRKHRFTPSPMSRNDRFTPSSSGINFKSQKHCFNFDFLVLSGVALLSFKASRVPKDKEHPYGHF